jgi:DnaK suppressor protein
MDPAALLMAQRAATVAQIESMTAELAAVAAATAGSNVDDEHDPEGATIAFEREQAATLLTRAKDQLVRIDDALARVADGSYGRCVSCGREISPARLEALPATTTCVQCAAARRR